MIANFIQLIPTQIDYQLEISIGLQLSLLLGIRGISLAGQILEIEAVPTRRTDPPELPD
jgi:hypothetical protein